MSKDKQPKEMPLIRFRVNNAPALENAIGVSGLYNLHIDFESFVEGIARHCRHAWDKSKELIPTAEIKLAIDMEPLKGDMLRINLEMDISDIPEEKELVDTLLSLIPNGYRIDRQYRSATMADIQTIRHAMYSILGAASRGLDGAAYNKLMLELGIGGINQVEEALTRLTQEIED